MLIDPEPIQIDAGYDGPYPCIPITCNVDLDFGEHNNISVWFADDLALTHNVIIRALNSIWLNAPLILPEDEADFVGYCLACVNLIRTHHTTQETIIFPLLQKKIDMRTNVVQHLAFEASLHDFEVYLKKIQHKSEHFDDARILELRQAFGYQLVRHLHDEISTVSTRLLAVFADRELKEILHTLDRHNTNIRESPTLFPLIMTHHNKADASKWVRPIYSFGFGLKILIRRRSFLDNKPKIISEHTVHNWVSDHVSYYIHRNYWKFSPYSAAGDFQKYPPREPL